jgi:hypothetical protein
MRTINYHVMEQEGHDEDGNYYFQRVYIPMTQGEARVVTENRQLRLENRAQKLINGKAPVRAVTINKKDNDDDWEQ